MADISKYNDLQKQLAGADAKMGQLQAALEKRAAETTKVIMGKFINPAMLQMSILCW